MNAHTRPCFRCRQNPIAHFDTALCDDCTEASEAAWPCEVTMRPANLGWLLWRALESSEAAGDYDAAMARGAWWRATRNGGGIELRAALSALINAAGGEPRSLADFGL